MPGKHVPGKGPPYSAKDKQCRVCKRFYGGPHAPINLKRTIPGVTRGRCPECSAEYDRDVEEVGMRRAGEREDVRSGERQAPRSFDQIMARERRAGIATRRYEALHKQRREVGKRQAEHGE